MKTKIYSREQVNPTFGKWVRRQLYEIERPAECRIKFIDYDGKEKELEANGLLATCIQHEVDHLNGILFIDYLSKLKKDMIVKKLIKHKKELNKVVL